MKIGPLAHNDDYGQARKTDAFTRLIKAINDLVKYTQGSDGQAFGPVRPYTATELGAGYPDPQANANCIVRVTGGSAPAAISDGSDWLYFDGTPV